MSIPQAIKGFHIAKAIKDVKREFDPKRRSKDWVLLVDNVGLEPKRIISRAAYYAIGRELAASEFNGGESETNKFLESRGFKVSKGST